MAEGTTSPDPGYAGYYPDYTGYGPTSSGNHPTRSQYYTNQSQRAAMGRLMDQMAERDAAVQSLSIAAYRPFASKEARQDPGKLRREVYTEKMGQQARDAILMGRQAGLIGSGSIAASAYHLAQGAFSGVRGTTYDSMGRANALSTRVSGSGAITEQVANVMQESMVKQLYGEGTADPSDFYGMNQEEAARLTAGVMRRSGTKNMVNVKMNASSAEKLDAAISGQGNPWMKSQMAQVRAKMQEEAGNDKEAQQAFINRTLQDPNLSEPLKKELTSMNASPIAVTVLEKGQKQVYDHVKSVAKGLASLRDIYGELASPELAHALTGIDGQGSLKLARRQASVIGQVTNAAAASGIDPKAMFEMIAQMSNTYRDQINQGTGLGAAGSKSAASAFSTVLSTQAGIVGAASQQSARDLRGKAEDLGLDGVVDLLDTDVTDATERTIRNYTQMQKSSTAGPDGTRGYRAMLMAQGLESMGDSDMSESMKAKRAEFDSLGWGAKDIERRQFLEQEMMDEFVQLTGLDEDQLVNSDWWRSKNRQLSKDPGALRETVAFSDRTINKEGSTEPLKRNMRRNGIQGNDEELDGLVTTMMEDLGRGGLINVSEAAREFRKGTNAEDRKAIAETELDKAGVTGDAKVKMAATFAEADIYRQDTTKTDAERKELVEKVIADSGMTDQQKRTFRSTLMSDDGGLNDYGGVSKVSAEERQKLIAQEFEKAGMTASEQETFKTSFLTEDWQIKDRKTYDEAMRKVAERQQSAGDYSQHAKTTAAADRIATREAAGQGDYFKNAEGGYSIVSLIQNMELGKQKGFSSPEETAHLVETMKSSGIRPEAVKELEKLYMTDVDTSDGVGVETLGKMATMNGDKDADALANTLGYKSAAELSQATKDPEKREKFLNALQEKTGLSMSGKADSMLITSSKLTDEAGKLKISENFKKAAVLEKLQKAETGRGMSRDKIAQVIQGGDEFTGMFEADTEKSAEKKDIDGTRGIYLRNQGELSRTADAIMGMSDEERMTMSDMDPLGKTVDAFKAQRDLLKESMKGKNGIQTIETIGKDNKKEVVSADDQLAKLNEVIALMEGQRQAEGKEMTVPMIKVENMEVTYYNTKK